MSDHGSILDDIPPPINTNRDLPIATTTTATTTSSSTSFTHEKRHQHAPPAPIITSVRDLPPRQSSLAQVRPDGTPRTPNRVRFEIGSDDDGNASSIAAKFQQEEDDLDAESQALQAHEGQRLLLTDTPAPIIRAALEWDPADHLESAKPRSNFLNALANMTNSIIGAGIIGQPYALRQAGLATGIALLVGLTFVIDWTIRLIVINSKLSGADSFQGTVQHCFGQPGMIAISLAQWAFAFGGMVAYAIICGDTIPQVFKATLPVEDIPFLWMLADRRAMMLILILGLSYPLSLHRDIAKLAKASTLALVSMIVIIMVVIAQGPLAPAEIRGPTEGLLVINGGVLQAIGVISFAYVCHHNSLLIYGSLKTPTLDRFAHVTHLSTAVSCVACLALGVVGFLSFGDKTEANILNNFPAKNVWANVARICFGVNMLTTFPLECLVAREVMMLYFWPNEGFNMRRHFLITSGLVGSAVAISLMTSNLGAVLELIGATSAAGLAYVLPPLCYIKLTGRSWKTLGAAATVLFGVVVIVISVINVIVRVVRA